MAYRVTAQYVHGDGSPRQGRIRFAPSTTVVGEERIILPAPLSVELDAQGALAVDLVGTDDPDYSPAGWVWTVTETVHGGRPPYSMTLTGDVDLSEVSPVVPPDDYVTLVPVSRSLIAGYGLVGGGTLAADRTLAVAVPLVVLDAGEPVPDGTPPGTVILRRHP